MPLQDLFTGSAGDLSGHTSDSGHTWSNLSPATYADNLTGSGTVYTVAASGFFNIYVSSYTPPSADYTVRIVLDPKSDIDNANGVMGRESGASISALNGYLGRYNQVSGEYELFKCVAGSFTGLGTNYAAAVSAGDTLDLVMSGTSISVKVNGTTRIGPVSDNSITATGSIALFMSNAVATTTTGLHFDSIESPVGATATAFALTGPSAGPANAASTNFTVTPNANYTGTFTPDVISGVSYAPTSLTWSGDASAKTFTVTKTTAGTVAINGTCSPALTEPSDVSYTAKATTTEKYTAIDGNPATTTFYTIINNDGTAFGARTSTNVLDLGSGVYKILAAVVPTDYAGQILWDQGGILFASEDLEPVAGAGSGGASFFQSGSGVILA